MKARWRILVAASAALLGAGTPALAQETEAPAQTEVIGPPQLQNFSLNGTVTREAPAPVEVQPGERQPVSPPATAQPTEGTAPRPSQAGGPTALSARSEQPARQDPAPSASASAGIDLPAPASPGIAPAPVIAGDEVAALAPGPGFAPEADDPTLGTSRNDVPMLPWLIAALALAAAAAWYFLRQRPREALAGAGAIDLFEAPSATREPPVRTPPAPPPAKEPTPEFVSTRLRPWIEIEFTPQRAVIDEGRAGIQFELSLYNSGSIPAREVLVEGSLINAGPLQDQQIRQFFDHPVAEGNRIPVIPPLKKIGVNTTVFLPLDQVRPIEVEGRQLFVPMIAFNALYGWSGGTGQSSTSYLVGKTTKGEKLAPFRLDLGPRVFRNLAAREHELRLRN